jgi:hypothetical protein
MGPSVTSPFAIGPAAIVPSDTAAAALEPSWFSEPAAGVDAPAPVTP